MNTVFLRLTRVTSGKKFNGMRSVAGLVDFDYPEKMPLPARPLVEAFHSACEPDTESPTLAERLDNEAKINSLLDGLSSAGMSVLASSFSRTAYDVDEFESPPIIFSSWRQTCLIVRIIMGDVETIDADVTTLATDYANSEDPALMRLDDATLGEHMFNVMVTAMDDAWESGAYEWSRDRILEHTDDKIKTRLAALEAEQLEELSALPTLFMYEQGTRGEARVGYIKKIQQRSGREFRVVIEFDDSVPSLTIDRLVELKWDLQLNDYEFSRTHWSVKTGDLYQILREAGVIADATASPNVAAAGSDERAASVELLPKKVFLVHGRDDGKKATVARFLETRAGLDVIILSERANKGRSILQKFSEESSGATYAIVLMTGDDLAQLRPDLVPSGKIPPVPAPRARQNVVFEMGFFIGKLGADRVCVLVPEGVERPSDFDGIVYVQLDEADGWQRQLVGELHAADVPVSETWWKPR